LTVAARRTALALALVALAALAAVLVLRSGGESCDLPGGGETPSGCWRPYADTSPFNQRLPAHPRLEPRSSQIVRAVTAHDPGHLDAGVDQTELDYGRPVYFSGGDDPSFRVHCTRAWGRCALEGRSIRIPDAAKPAGGGDAHLTVVDPATGWEYDMWKVARKPAGGGELVTAWGGRTRIDGSGLGSEAVAASFGTLAGIVRPEELEDGRIDHALFMTVPCVARIDGRNSVYPARGNARGCTKGQDAPLLGARFQLAMTGDEIDGLDVPGWQRTLLHAMAEYGMFVGDTGGPPGWGLQVQSDTSYTSLGREPKLAEFAKKAGWRASKDDDTGRTVYAGDFAGGVDWRSRLRVVAPCVSRGRC
jgi:hypothetical protein